jgi:hypothetical protein
MLETICNLGVTQINGEASWRVFRMANGAWADSQYQIGARFTRTDFSPSDRGIIVIDEEGDKIYIPAGEYQCFKEPNETP